MFLRDCDQRISVFRMGLTARFQRLQNSAFNPVCQILQLTLVGAIDLLCGKTFLEFLETLPNLVQGWDFDKSFGKANNDQCYRRASVQAGWNLLVFRHNWRLKTYKVAKIEETLPIKAVLNQTNSTIKKVGIGEKDCSNSYLA